MAATKPPVLPKPSHEFLSKKQLFEPYVPVQVPPAPPPAPAAEKQGTLHFFQTLLGPPPGKRLSDLHPLLACWLVGRVVLFVFLLVLPVCLFDLDHLKRMWFAPLMGIIAASIPASGAPVAGGVVFLQLLNAVGVCPRDAVAFSAATQFFGVLRSIHYERILAGRHTP